MPSSYLQSADYAAYGLPSTTTTQQVQAASTLIDGYLKRPEGLVWAPDAGGNPAWMASLSPTISLTVADAIAPGRNVWVTPTGGIRALTVGDVLILDRTNAAAAEAVAVQSIQNGQIMLQHVVYEHPGPCTLELGLTIKQHKFMPQGRPLTTLAYTPVVRLLSGQGRYGYGRRGEASRYQVDEFNLLASLSHFGGPPVWEFFPLEHTGVDAGSGQVWVPAGVMLAYYSEVNLWYVAGWQQSNLPSEIKQACANLICAASSTTIPVQLQKYTIGPIQSQRFAPTIIDDDTKALLNPYRARLFG